MVTKDMSGKPPLNAHPESTVNGGVATMSLHLKKRQERRPSRIVWQPSRNAHCLSHDASGSKVAASPQLKRARAGRFTLVQVVVEVDKLYVRVQLAMRQQNSLIAERRRLRKTAV